MPWPVPVVTGIVSYPSEAGEAGMVIILLLRGKITWRKYISASECRVFIDMQLREAFKQHVCIPLVRNKYTDPSH